MTGLDKPSDVGATRSPQLSALRPRPDHPEWDCAVWLDILTLPGHAVRRRVLRRDGAVDLQQLLVVRRRAARVVEGLGLHGDAAPGPRTRSSTRRCRTRSGPGSPLNDNWDSARQMLDILDPARVFTSAFVTKLLY